MNDTDFDIQPKSPALADPDAEQVRRFIARMKPDNPVRVVASSLLSGAAVWPSDIHRIATTLSSFSSRKWKERYVAAWVLGRAARTDEEREGAAGWLKHVLEQYPRNEPLERLTRSYQRTALALIALGVVAALAGAGTPLALIPAL